MYEFRDRGIKKWQGMFVSAQTEQESHNAAVRNRIISAKPCMTEDTIQQVIQNAVINNMQIAIQLTTTDDKGSYLPDVVGFYKGYDHDYLFIGNTKVQLELIRNVEIVKVAKWMDF